MTTSDQYDDEAAHMSEVDSQGPWGPTEADEMAVLHRLYKYDTDTGTFSAHIGD